MTATDVAGWIAAAPVLVAASLPFAGLTWAIERTDRGRRWANRVIDRIVGSR